VAFGRGSGRSRGRDGPAAARGAAGGGSRWLLDGGCAFAGLDPEGLTICWGAHLAEAADRIAAARWEGRAANGWIVGAYLLRGG
jgi:hypothetical protein